MMEWEDGTTQYTLHCFDLSKVVAVDNIIIIVIFLGPAMAGDDELESAQGTPIPSMKGSGGELTN
jgi:hypothetical protein